MRIGLITPNLPGVRSGNGITAFRWAGLLRDLGLRVSVSSEFGGDPVDMMVALNAFRSAGSVRRFRERHPDRPLVVALTGTDLYRFIHSHPQETRETMEHSDRLVVLNALAHRAVPPDQADKCHLILESARPLPRPRRPRVRTFDVCVVGHLRSEKDPLLAAVAARGLRSSSRIRVRHYGEAYSDDWAAQAREEMERNSRYRWFGEVPHWKIRREYGSSRLLVQSSRIEGGPNSVSEAIVAGLPVLGTEIDGIKGVLGPAYAGYFPVGDSSELCALMSRAEDDPAFLAGLEEHVLGLAPGFSPERERDRWVVLLDSLLAS